MPKIDKVTGAEVRKRFAPWFSSRLEDRKLTRGAASYYARKRETRTKPDGLEINSTEIRKLESGMMAPTKSRVIELSRVFYAPVTDALWHSYPEALIGLAEELANEGGSPFPLWRRLERYGPAQWAGAVAEVPVAHAAALLYCYFGPQLNRERRLREALMLEIQSEARQERYYDAVSRAEKRRGGRLNPALELAEAIVVERSIPFGARIPSAANLIASWARSIASPLFDGALQGWPEGSVDSDGRIAREIRKKNREAKITVIGRR